VLSDRPRARRRPSAAESSFVVVSRGFASQEDVLKAFGLQMSDLDQFKALGEAARKPPEENEDEGSSESDGEVFSFVSLTLGRSTTTFVVFAGPSLHLPPFLPTSPISE